MRDQMEKLFHNRAFHFIDGEVIQRAILFSDTAIVCQLVAERPCAAAPDSVCGHLRVRCFYTHGGLFAFSACLPIAHEVQELVHATVQTLLSFAGTPDLNAMFDEPLHKERRFILSAAQTVKHEHQQHVKLFLFG